jgi:predicted RNA-binding Zn ribbon-like protein
LGYYEDRISFVEELVNSYDVDVNEEHPEKLMIPEDADALLAKWGLLGEGEACTEVDLAAVRAVRGDLRAIFEAEDEAVAASMLNALLAGAPVVSTLNRHGANGWRLDVRAAPNLTLARRVAVEAGLGLADAIEEYGFERLSVCEADPCRDVFLDISRNRSRRYCGQKCANRHNVAAFRQRQRT